MFRISELRNKDIINMLDGRRLGYIRDIELDLEQGCVRALLLPTSKGLLGMLGRDNSINIAWQQIVKIGIDVIIVNLPSFTSLPSYSDNTDLAIYEPLPRE